MVDPILVTIALFVQSRAPGSDPPRAAPLAVFYGYALTASAAIFTMLGMAMLFAASIVIAASPLPLTPLTSRAIGSWVLATGVVFATMAWENDVDRIGPATVASFTLPVLLLIGMARYREQFNWSGTGWMYLMLIALVASLGSAGILAKRNRRGA